MKRILFALAMVLCIAACSSDDDEPTLKNTVTGTWYKTAYLCSDNYFIAQDDGTRYVFNQDGTYQRIDLFGEETHGTYTFDDKTSFIQCNESRGWNLQIYVDFESKDKATFHVTGRTVYANETLKMERRK